ncbi:hypothetical protein L6164_011995 [Bauhinia variegata]|uniref:Uncharacterized protein n=1 Tax=Bauhinia variegata TaxID=167791 RepID=A0ACB9PBJ2_BAUVA|nr:hypothetical protein L6164_011995 [Bauhinia variegata]
MSCNLYDMAETQKFEESFFNVFVVVQLDFSLFAFFLVIQRGVSLRNKKISTVNSLKLLALSKTGQLALSATYPSQPQALGECLRIYLAARDSPTPYPSLATAAISIQYSAFEVAGGIFWRARRCSPGLVFSTDFF